MIIKKSFPDSEGPDNFRRHIRSSTVPLDTYFHNPAGLYSRSTNRRITILDVEPNISLRAEPFPVVFHGIFISFFSKRILLGWIGPSWLYTLLTLLIVAFPLEYISFRLIALAVWVIVYMTNLRRIFDLKRMIETAFDD